MQVIYLIRTWHLDYIKNTANLCLDRFGRDKENNVISTQASEIVLYLSIDSAIHSIIDMAYVLEYKTMLGNICDHNSDLGYLLEFKFPDPSSRDFYSIG